MSLFAAIAGSDGGSVSFGVCVTASFRYIVSASNGKIVFVSFVLSALLGK